MRPGLLRAAIRIGGFAALAFVLVDLLNGRVADRAALALSAVEVWALAGTFWLAIEVARRPR